MRGLIALSVAMFLGWTTAAGAVDCPWRPDALGTERVLAVDPTEHARIGTMQYSESLPLADKEVVLTFDDGPLPHHTGPVLEALAAECVKATFFIVGRQARAFPAWVRRIHDEGHTIATHSQTHPTIFTRLPMGAAEQEIEQGIASTTTALGSAGSIAPFFRFPGLGRSHAVETYLASRSIMVWSADFPADDWTHISAEEVMRRALERLERNGKGVLLLHDIQPATASMLPHLLRELKNRGYHIVQVVPAGPDRPKTATDPEAWVMHRKPAWSTGLSRLASSGPAPSLQSFGWPHPFVSRLVAPMPIPPGLAAYERSHPGPPMADASAVALPALHSIPTYSVMGGFGDLAVATGENWPVVAPNDTFSAMLAPPAVPTRHKARPANVKLRPAVLPPPPPPRPLAGLGAPPRVFSRSPPPRLVSQWP